MCIRDSDRATGHLEPLAPEFPPYLAGAVDGLILLVDADDLGCELLVAELPGRRGAGLRGIVGGRGDRQHRADRLDPELRRTHLPSVSAVMPNFVATEPIAAPWESYAPLGSRTIRPARSLTSRGYLFCVFMTPSSQRLESPAKAGRFKVAVVAAARSTRPTFSNVSSSMRDCTLMTNVSPARA